MAMTAGLGAQAAEGKATAVLASSYNSRGMLLTDEPVFQPAVSLSLSNGLYFTAWGNMDLTGRMCPDANTEFSEVDFTVAYQRSWQEFQLEIGWIEYLYPHQTSQKADGTGSRYYATDGTREIYGKIGAIVGLLQPSVTVYYDFDEVYGFYVMAGLTAERSLTDCLKVNVGALLTYADAKYNRFNFGVDGGGLNDGSLSVGADWKITERLTLSACIQYMRLLNPYIREAAEERYFNNTSGNMIKMVSLAYDF